MSPNPSGLEAELRGALSSRTEHVELSPDFYAGVERRARGLRRQRVAASVAGSALAAGALGLGGPILASSLVREPAPPVASAPATTPTTSPAPAFALDPAAPWAYRGDPLDQGTVDTTAREWGTARGLAEEQVRFWPLYGETSGGETVLVFLARGGDVAPRWGVARSSESGPELVVDESLPGPTYALPYAFTTSADDVDRLLVVAAPQTSLEYGADTAAEWRPMESVAPGVGATDLDGNQADDQVRVVGPGGQLAMVAAPSPAGRPGPGASPAPQGEGPGTDSPRDVDTAPYALRLADPWSYRGPAEGSLHPDLGSQALRLFEQGGTGRSGWSERGLLLVERPDEGLSVLVQLRTRGTEAVVTTTSQRQDEAPAQSEQVVAEGQLLVQAFVPAADGGGLLVALAAPRTGAVETTVRGAEQLHGRQGYGLWRVPAGSAAGEVLLYGEGDGLLFHSEPARRS